MSWGCPIFWETGFSLPLAQESKIQKLRKSKMQPFLIFRCRYLPSIRLRKTISRDLDFTHQLPDLAWNSQTSFSQTSATTRAIFCDAMISRTAKWGGFKRGGFPIWTCPSFFVLLGLSRFFWDFPDLPGECPKIFPICPFPLSRSINSAYEEQSRKGPRHNLDLSRKKWETPGLETPRFPWRRFPH